MQTGIVVPLDGSAWSEYALPYAALLARLGNTPLRLTMVHVPIVSQYVDTVPIIDPEMDAASRASEQTYLNETVARVGSTEAVSTNGVVLDGPVVDTLLQFVHETEASLIVMSTHGRGGFNRAWLGSTADALVRRSHVPVLALHPTENNAMHGTRPVFKRVLVPLDGSALSERILPEVSTICHQTGAAVVLFRVVDILSATNAPFTPRMPSHVYSTIEAHRAAANAYLETVAEQLRAEQIQASTKTIVHTHAPNAILDEATSGGYDLVALATHGHGGLTRLVMGSVADKVLRSVSVPVLLYRPA